MEVVLPTLQQLERVARESVCLVVLTPVQMNPGQALERLSGVRGRIGVERPRVRRLEVLDRVLLVTQEERETTEHEQKPTLGPLVVELLSQLLGPLRVAPGKNVVTLALRDQRGLGVSASDGAPVADVLGELERTLRVVACGDVVAEPTVAARTPLEDLGAERSDRKARALGERERLVEQRDRGGDARELVPAHAEAQKHLRAIDVRELGSLGELACGREKIDRLRDAAELLERPCLTGKRAELERRRPRLPNAR